jgi:ATP-dependent Clp protease ATP-binding subunit ClpA
VTYTDEALTACVKLTERYITDRAFPDKAIDAMDEVGSRIHLQHAEVPEIITRLQKQIEEMNEKRFEYQEVSPDTPWGGSAVDEVLEREELQAKRSKTLEKVTSLLLSLGIDAEELYRKLDSDEADTVVRNLPILFGVCYTTSGEMAKLRRLFEDLGETEP